MTVTTAAQADVLGRLLMVQQMLDALPDEQQIGEFTRRALVQIPGVKDVLVCIRGQITPPDARYQAICAQCGQALDDPDAIDWAALGSEPGTHCFPMRTVSQLFGLLIVTVSAEVLLHPYLGFLANIANAVGLVLNTRLHHERQTETNEQRLKRLNRTYRTISRCTHHLIRARNEKALAQDLCDTMVEEGGYRMAWVGYALRDEAKSILPFAHAGQESGYLNDLNLTWADTERGSGPGARCIRDGTPKVTRDIPHDPAFAFWREEAAKRGYVSSIAMPLKNSEGTFGFLGMYSASTDAFDEEEVALLEEVADALAFGIVTLRERAERDALTQERAYLATHDQLTGLANRPLFGDRLQQALSHARQHEHPIAVVCLDLDNFKRVNDSFGTAVGNEVLLEIARRLSGVLRGGSTAARFSSGEFVLLLTEQESKADTSDTLMQILAAVREPTHIAGKEITVTASIGCSFYPADGEDSEILLRRAKVSMHRAKEIGRDEMSFFAAGLDWAVTERMNLEIDLRHAVRNSELVLHYQPQVHLGTSKLVGFEALMRWQHPQRGLISPAAFIPVAEDSGLIVAMGEWALSEGCSQAKEWQNAGVTGATVSINLSPRQFRDKRIVDTVRSILQETGLGPSQLELEITESSIMLDVDQVIAIMSEFKSLGATLSIDDFGTGYSSLNYLRRFPVDKLKIDQSFVRYVDKAPSADAIVRTIIVLGHSLGLKVIAEGVETVSQARFLRQNGCDEIQGFLIERALPAHELQAIFLNPAACLWVPS